MGMPRPKQEIKVNTKHKHMKDDEAISRFYDLEILLQYCKSNGVLCAKPFNNVASLSF